MKKFISVIAVIFLAAVLVACNGKNQSSTNGEDSSYTVSSPSFPNSPKDNTNTPSSQIQNPTVPSAPPPSVPEQSEDQRGEEDSQEFLLQVTPISQYPELPTGCEITSLATLLNYYGIQADKCDLADNYLKKGEVGTVDFREAFEGDPRDPYSYGCYAPVIVEAANNYLGSKNSPLKATDISGTSLEGLFDYLNNGTPVIVWGTQDCKQARYSVIWNVNGKEIQWITPEHCMVLVGYSDTSVFVADPLYGDIRSYNKELFASCYNFLFKQAVIMTIECREID